MNRAVYEKLREKAFRTAERIGAPSFYVHCRKELDISSQLLHGDPLLEQCRAAIDPSQLHPAHGMDHGEAVALEAGAILQAEGRLHQRISDAARELMLCAHIAGLLHDIMRNGKDHTIHGSREAARILEGFDLQDSSKRYIIAAIRNHEAFSEILPSEDEDAKLISDCLYDADKFRWGPDNFTKTLWLILETNSTTPEELYRVFEEKMGWISRIRGTFRSETGRRFGPEFIDMGLAIGREIYSEMGMILER